MSASMPSAAAGDGGVPRWRVGHRLAALAAGAVLVTATACATPGGVFKTGEMDEARHKPDFGVEQPLISVVPVDPTGYDQQVAQRVADQFRQRGYSIRLRVPRAREQAAVMSALCPREQSVPSQDGVVFATWNRLVLRDCRTHEVAYEIEGGYSGVDEMVRWMDRYLRGLPRPQEG